MKLNCLTALLLVVISLNVFGKEEKKYPVSDIPEILKEDANSVIRVDEKLYTVVDNEQLNLTRKFAITILNSRAEDLASFGIYYDKFMKIGKLNARIYDADGNLVDKVKPSDIMDLNIAAGQSAAIDDSRIKTYTARHNSFPFTFEFEYEIEIKATLFYPDWQPVKNYYQSVVFDMLSIQVPPGIDFSYKESNLTTPVVIEEVDGAKKYTWKLNNFEALEPEPYSPDISEFTPFVFTRAREFMMDDYPGTLDSWATLGQWVETLNRGRDELSPETIAKLNELVTGCTTTEEKVAKIYSYLQSNTRYVSIQLGIGGWQTIPANEVDEKGYGDCKALSNYMKAMLQAVGVESKYVLISAGSNARSLDEEFPKSQFNHAIVMVPNENDTIWLECTSQRNPLGYQGRFTGARKALVVDGEKTRLVETTHYSAEQNVVKNVGEFKLLADGSATVATQSSFGGLDYDDIRSMYFEGAEEQEKFLYDWIDLNGVKITDYSLSREEGRIPQSELQLTMQVNNYGTSMNDRMFVPVNGFNRWTNVPKRIRNRKTDIVKRYSFTEEDEYTYVLPEGYEIESIPENIKIENQFGIFSTATKVEDGKITYSRKLVLFEGTFQKEAYPDLIDFYKNISKSDKNSFVLKQGA